MKLFSIFLLSLFLFFSCMSEESDSGLAAGDESEIQHDENTVPDETTDSADESGPKYENSTGNDLNEEIPDDSAWDKYENLMDPGEYEDSKDKYRVEFHVITGSMWGETRAHAWGAVSKVVPEHYGNKFFGDIFGNNHFTGTPIGTCVSGPQAGYKHTCNVDSDCKYENQECKFEYEPKDPLNIPEGGCDDPYDDFGDLKSGCKPVEDSGVCETAGREGIDVGTIGFEAKNGVDPFGFKYGPISNQKYTPNGSPSENFDPEKIPYGLNFTLKYDKTADSPIGSFATSLNIPKKFWLSSHEVFFDAGQVKKEKRFIIDKNSDKLLLAWRDSVPGGLVDISFTGNGDLSVFCRFKDRGVAEIPMNLLSPLQDMTIQEGMTPENPAGEWKSYLFFEVNRYNISMIEGENIGASSPLYVSLNDFFWVERK